MCFFFFFNDTATTEIYTLSLHDALPISKWVNGGKYAASGLGVAAAAAAPGATMIWAAGWVLTWKLFGCGNCANSTPDRKSTRLNSSHQIISYAVFCLEKKKTTSRKTTMH